MTRTREKKMEFLAELTVFGRLYWEILTIFSSCDVYGGFK
jgi:hypothetical protein